MTPVQRSLWTNWVLVAFALLLTAAVVVTSRSVTSGERESRSRHLLTAFRSDDISRVTFEQAGQRWVIDKRASEGLEATDDPRWTFVEPMQGEAEEATLDQLMRSAQFATWLRKVAPSDVDRKAFGLEAPQSVLGIQMGAIRYRVHVAGEAPAPPGARYVEVSGQGAPDQGVYVVSQSTAEDLSPDPEDFRIRQLIPYSGDVLARIEASLGQERVTLLHHGKSGFRFEKLLGGARLGRISKDQLLLGFSRTRAERFLPVEQATALQQASDELLTLKLVPTDAEREPATITLGGKCPSDETQIIALRSSPRPAAACIEDPRLHPMFDEPQWLADRTLLDASVDEVERLSIVSDGSKLVLVRSGDGFELREPRHGEVEKGAAEQRLEEMLNLRGTLVEEPDLDALGLVSPAIRVELARATSDPDGDREIVVLSAVNAQGEVFARRLDDGAVLRLGRSALRVFSTNELLLQARQLLSLQAKEVRSISVERGGIRWVLSQPAPGEFELLEPTGFAVDSGVAVRWVDAVRQLHAERWVAASDDGSFGLDEPLLRFSVEREPGARTSIIVGGKAAGGFYARLEESPGVFVLDEQMVQALSTLLIDRSGFSFDPDLVQTLTVRRGETFVELVRLGSELVQRAGNVELSSSQQTELLDALSLVRPEAAVAFGDETRRYDFSKPLLDVRYTLLVGGEEQEQHYQVGVGDYYRDMAVYLARLEGRPVVYAIARQLVADVLGAL